MTTFAAIAAWALFLIVIAQVLAQLALYVAAAVELRRIRRRDRHQLWARMLASPLAPRITVLVPAYNESVTIVDALQNLLGMTYPNLEVVVVNDGSSDDTLQTVIDAFDMHALPPVFQRALPTAPVENLYRSPHDPRLILVDKGNGGKADSLNAALNIASGELVCSIDADTLVARDALQQLVPPFLASKETVAVGGTVRLSNDARWNHRQVQQAIAPKHPLLGAQAVEYPRAFLIGRLAWNVLGGNLIISGAFGVFRRSALIDIGGYQTGAIGEDMELIVRLRRHAAELDSRATVVFSPDPVAYTEAPQSLRTLARQRNRWFRGLLDVLVRHRRMILNPRYGSAGMLAMPYFVLVEALAPVIEAIGVTTVIVALLFGWISPAALAPLALVYLGGLLLSYGVVMTDGFVFHTYERTTDRVRMALHVLFEQAVFRPLTVVWRLWGLGLFLQGRTEWGVQQRRGVT